VLLIDEIDKGRHRIPQRSAARTRSHGILRLRDRRTRQSKTAPDRDDHLQHEKELPDAFLRRCFFHYIKFPDADTMHRIVDVHFPTSRSAWWKRLADFFEVREVPGLKKKPSTSELLDWLKLLLNEDMNAGNAEGARPAQADPAAARRAVEERAGRASVRAAGVFEPARGVRERRQPRRRQNKKKTVIARLDRAIKYARFFLGLSQTSLEY